MHIMKPSELSLSMTIPAEVVLDMGASDEVDEKRGTCGDHLLNRSCFEIHKCYVRWLRDMQTLFYIS